MSLNADSDELGFELPRRYFAATAILIGVLMSALDGSIVNIALPTISHALQVDPASVIWVANGYLVASAATMLICASLGSMVGERRFYTAGMVFFTLSSLGCGLSQTVTLLVAMRIIQGISYAVMISVGLGLYRVIFPVSSLGTIFGLNALTFAVGTAIGPALGGVIISYLSWPWIFYINVPLGVIAIILSFAALGTDSRTEKSFDWLGAVTSATAFGLMVVTVGRIGRWSNGIALLSLTTSVALLGAFVFIQAKKRNPLLPLDIFTSRRYSFAVISSFTMFVSQGMALVALPFVLQHTYSYSVLQSAFIIKSWPIAVAVCAPIAGKLSNRFNPTKISTAGIVVLCLALGSFVFIQKNAEVGSFIWRLIACGIGYGFFLPPNNKEMFLNVTKNLAVTASGVLSTARTAGQSIGAAIVSVVIVFLNGHLVGSPGMHFIVYVFGLASIISACASFASVLRLHR